MKTAKAFNLALEAYNLGIVEGEEHCTKSVNSNADTKVMYIKLSNKCRRYRKALEEVARCSLMPQSALDIAAEALKE